MAYFGNAARQLLESLQSVRRTHSDLRKFRVGHKGSCLVTMAATNRQIFMRVSLKISNFIWCVQKIIHFSFVLSICTECGNKVACSREVPSFQKMFCFQEK